MKNINYGIDAPKVIRNLFLLSVIFFGLVVFLTTLKISDYTLDILSYGMLGGGTICLIEGLLMVGYAKFGKFRHGERMLKLITWTGKETVLDVGVGLGLLMIGAAKRPTTGKAIGIDIWNKEDLSANSYEQALVNAQLEGVADKIEIKNQNILQTDFQENYFDVILSNLCLHNIYNKDGRRTACREIHRILKQNGVAVISDFRHTKEYKTEFEKLGMTTEKIGTYYFDTFPPLTIIRAVKK
jgi:ubiquinone/menaquinone biosynthesis C-methylase UbiE